MVTEAGQLDSSIKIVTPENIAFQYEVAGPFRRLPAFLIDLSIRAVILMAVGFAMSILVGVTGGTSIAFLVVFYFVMDWFYGGLFETYWNGQTPGKRLMGIRVLSHDGQPINGLQAVLRNILRYVDMMPLVPTVAFTGQPGLGGVPTFMVGLFAVMFSDRYQRLGDMVCGTIVVVEDRSWLFGVAKLEDRRAVELASYIPANFQASRDLARALAVYVERRRFFSVPRRREIARHLGRPLLERFNLPADTSHDLLLCALYYRVFVADRSDLPAGGDEADSPFAIQTDTQ